MLYVYNLKSAIDQMIKNIRHISLRAQVIMIIIRNIARKFNIANV